MGDDFAAAVSLIELSPMRFHDPIWLERDHVGKEHFSLLPRGVREISASRASELESYFGARGRFPAVHIPTGAIGGM